MGRRNFTARSAVVFAACLIGCVAAGSSPTLAATSDVAPTFAPAVAHAGGYAYGLTAGDLGQDGRVDIVLSTAGGAEVFLGDGHGRFAKPMTYATGAGTSHAVVLSDLTGSGTLDIVTANDHTFSVLLGKGDGTFSKARNYPLPGIPGTSTSVAAGALTGDGKTDLVFAISADSGSHTALAVALGNGDGTFGPVRTYLTPLSNGGPGGSRSWWCSRI